MKRKNAISLIVLVITIIVMAILATTMIITLSNTNIINESKKTTFKYNMGQYKEAYEMYVANEYAKDTNFNRSSVNAVYGDSTFTKIFGENVSENYKSLEVKDGNLIYKPANDEEAAALAELNISDGTVVVAASGKYILSVFGQKYQIDENTTWQDIIDSSVPVTVEIAQNDNLKINNKEIFDYGPISASGFSHPENAWYLNGHASYGNAESATLTTPIISIDGTNGLPTFGKDNSIDFTVCSDVVCEKEDGYYTKTITDVVELMNCIGQENVIYVTKK